MAISLPDLRGIVVFVSFIHLSTRVVKRSNALTISITLSGVIFLPSTRNSFIASSNLGNFSISIPISSCIPRISFSIDNLKPSSTFSMYPFLDRVTKLLNCPLGIISLICACVIIEPDCLIRSSIILKNGSTAPFINPKLIPFLISLGSR